MPVKKIITYNVYQGGEDRFPYIKEVIQSENPDILAIQEACNWKQSGRFLEIAQLLNVPIDQSTLFRSNSRSKSGRIYDIAFYSKFPIKSQKVFNNPETIWHVLPYLILEMPFPLHIIIAHLSPQSEDWRLKEITKIDQLLSQHTSEPMILMGDINSLSPDDPYPPLLPKQLKDNSISKFGNPPRFDVMTQLSQAGWHDTLTAQEKSKQDLQITVTEESEDKDHLNLRLDYIMVNKTLLHAVKKSYVVETPTTRKASDHFPVVTEINI